MDLRDEIGREDREDLAKEICHGYCPYRFSCLEFALLNNEKHGVWGGMSQGDRREFKIYLRKQGYKELPSGSELRANVNLYEGDDGYEAEPAILLRARSLAFRNGYRHLDEEQSPFAAPPDQADQHSA